MRGVKHWLWRAVDQDGFVLDVRWSWFFDQFSADISCSYGFIQAAIFIGSVLFSYASFGVNIPCDECGRSLL